ncbi:hypothetical protein SAMN05444266_10823 [Chitinophaga jiangningensis]|uniref:Uncharacterized protein n=1 Tax=Chitinophaga jiangningensis TaxID=1419482 RepID=A0A1M7IM36_9BACT|nr:hypothetical protein [Chitinophaga jiangningensis]SHM41884.1 hypothetical protein SAMN05444266_10823 [Chitinophaga jiangningensis]
MNPELSNKWLAAYYEALQLSWTVPDFKPLLLRDSRLALQSVNFTYPDTITLEFKEVTDGNFSNFPEFPISIFDYPPATPTTLKVPLVPPPPPGSTDLSYLLTLQKPLMLCCCMCF